MKGILKKIGLLSLLIVIAFAAFKAYSLVPLKNLELKPKTYDAIYRIERAQSLVGRFYYDPSRIHPLKMLEEGMNNLAGKIPELLVDFSGHNLTLSLGNSHETIHIKTLKSLYDILDSVSQAFSFLQKNYKGDVDSENREYAFIEGMLKPLDPHSNLFTPEDFREFKTQTEGEYGGIGIVVGTRDDELTVIAPLPDTPASEAGLETDDKITQIDQRSTINMPINEAVDLLRGNINSKVTLTIQRKNKEPFDVMLTRRKIIIQSIDSKVVKLDSKRLGILAVRSFQEDTYKDALKALKNMAHEGSLNGLVIDLRNNPGGLLDQCLALADKFLNKGDLLYTAGANNEDEQVNPATYDHDDLTDIPIIVLVNGGSASASEIVAGALQNNNRALVMGTQSFGKGSVQSVFTLKDDASVKLTIYQYLTPGHVSIQAVGITPDVWLESIHLEKDAFDLKADKRISENMLEEHLENSKYIQKSDPAYFMDYFEAAKPENTSEYTTKIDEDKDYPLKLALDILSKTHSINRQNMLTEALSLLDEEKTKQQKQIIENLKSFDIDWSKKEKNQNPVSFKHDSGFYVSTPENKVSTLKAGNEVTWNLSLQNTSKNSSEQVLVVVNAENPLLDQREFVFGRINSLETRKAQITFKIPENMVSLDEEVKLDIFSANIEMTTLTVPVTMQAKEHPLFVAWFHMEDGQNPDSQGNKNGIVDPGETIKLGVDLTNDSNAEAKNVTVNWRNLEGAKVKLVKGRDSLGELAPHQTKQAAGLIEVPATTLQPSIKVEMSAVDRPSFASFFSTLTIPLGPKPTASFSPALNTVQKQPIITITQTKISSDRTSFHVKGETSDDQSLKDLMIFLGTKKVFYRSSNHNTSLQFDMDIPLNKGLNVISVQARDENLLTQTKILSIMGPPKN